MICTGFLTWQKRVHSACSRTFYQKRPILLCSRSVRHTRPTKSSVRPNHPTDPCVRPDRPTEPSTDPADRSVCPTDGNLRLCLNDGSLKRWICVGFENMHWLFWTDFETNVLFVCFLTIPWAAPSGQGFLFKLCCNSTVFKLLQYKCMHVFKTETTSACQITNI